MNPPPDTRPPGHWRVALAVSLLLSAFTAVSLLPSGHAVAAPGPAPAPVERVVIADVHADAIATFWDDGALTLGTQADTPAAHTRYDADNVWFHVDHDSRFDDFPAGFEFVAPAGSTVWLAPEVQAAGQIWPGFSTESVPAGTLDGDDTTFTLLGVEGPGDVELWQSGSFGQVMRLWSSDEDVKTFTRKRVHMHANWAFTAPGVYHVSVRASGTVAGNPVADTAVYTFVVGDLPEQVTTSTSLTASATEVTAGEPVVLTASVSPGGAAGYVEFLRGSTVLGHEPVADGRAALEASLPTGTHAVSARFVPRESNLAVASTSDPVTVKVTDSSGVPFGIGGVRSAYQPGDVLQAHVLGHTLTAGQRYRWSIRPVGGTGSGYAFTGTGDQAAEGIVEQVLDASHDGYELRVQLREGSTTLSESDWVPLVVSDAVTPISAIFPTEPTYLGDDFEVQLSGRAPAEGETLRLAYRFGSPWFPADRATLSGDRFIVSPDSAMTDVEWTLQVVRDGSVVAQSAPTTYDVLSREVLVEGVRKVYRVGQTITASATVHPAVDGALYRWLSYEFVDGALQTTIYKEGTDAGAMSIDLPATMDLDGTQLYFAAIRGAGTANEIWAAGWSTTLTVSDTDPSTQLLFFEGLGGHYHQGGDINLSLVADPELAEGDTIAWEWAWPGAEWATLHGASGMSHVLTAEQALEGVQVRATLTFADSGEQLTTDPVTIHVDDHGAPPRQQLSIAGETAVVAGTEATLTAQLAAPSVLATYQWQRKAAGADEYAVVPAESGEELKFPVTEADQGASYRVALLKPDGSLAYGPSDEVTLSVEPADPTGPGDPSGEGVATTVSAAAVTQVYGRSATLPVTVSPDATGTVTVQAGSQTLTASVSGGRASVTLPAKALHPGVQRLAVAYAGVPGTYRPSTATAEVTVARAVPTVTVRPVKAKVKRGRSAAFVVTVRGEGVNPTGTVAVRIGGRTGTMKLDASGRAKVEVKVGAKAKLGKRKVTVTYAGDDYVVGAAGGTARIRVVR